MGKWVSLAAFNTLAHIPDSGQTHMKGSGDRRSGLWVITCPHFPHLLDLFSQGHAKALLLINNEVLGS